LVELDATVVADADLLAAVEQRGAEVVGQATDADRGGATGDALHGQTGQARDRLGDADVRQLADVLGGNRFNDLARSALGVDRALDTGSDAGNRHRIQCLRVLRLVLCLVLLRRRRLLVGRLRIGIGRKHHRCRCQRHAEQITFQLHHHSPSGMKLSNSRCGTRVTTGPRVLRTAPSGCRERRPMVVRGAAAQFPLHTYSSGRAERA
jgi:hypothetical protein